MDLRKRREDDKIKAIKLAAQGLSRGAIAKVLGRSPDTITLWKKQDRLFKKAFDGVRSEAAKDLVEHSLFELAKGAKEEVITDKFMVTELNRDGEEVIKERTVTTRYKAPNEKALAMIAYKYDRGSYTNDDKLENNVTIKITQQDRSLSIEERKKLLSSEGDEIVDVDYRELRSELDSEAGELGLLGE